MQLSEVSTHPADLQEALRETVKWLDIGDVAMRKLLTATGQEAEIGDALDREIQGDLEAVASFLDATIEGRKLGRYIWRNRNELKDTTDNDAA